MTQNKRNSSFELLRIIAIFLIVSYHFVNHSGILPNDYQNLSFADILAQTVYMFGRPACSFFAMISGYFTVSSKFGKNYYSKALNLFIKTVIYSVGAFLIYRFIFGYPTDFEDFIESCVFIVDHWYIRIYIVVMMFAPFVNKMLNSLSFKEYKSLLFVLFFIYIVLNTFTNYSLDFGDLFFLTFYYIFGAFVRLHKEQFKLKNKIYLIVSLGCVVLIIASVLFFDFGSIYMDSDYLFAHALYFRKYNNLLSFGFVLFLFIYFSNLKFENNPINIYASSVLGIYILHDTRFIRDLIWRKWALPFGYQDNPLLYMFIKIFAVLVLCFIIDYIYQMAIDKLVKRISLYIASKLKNKSTV